MEFNRHAYLYALIALGLLLLLFPLDAFAACDEEVYRQSPDHIYIEGTCDTVEAADEACIAFKVSHNYPPTTCNHAFYENLVWAGWLYENGSNSLPFYLGQFYFSTTRISPNKNAGAPPCPDGCFGDPVNAGTGNKFETHQEYRGEGVFPLQLSCTYNSELASKYIPDTALTFGRKRNHSYSSRITYFPAATVPLVYLTRPDGKVMRFKKSGNSWIADADNGARLVSVMQAGDIVGWQFEDEQRNREQFDSAGRLTNVFDPFGHQHVVNYNGQGQISKVTDIAGRALVFEYDEPGKPVAHILLPDGNRLHFFIPQVTT